MSAEVTSGAEQKLRRARHLIPLNVPRRGEIFAVGAVVLVVAHLLLAQLTILLAVAFYGVSKLTRWRLSWLAVPAVAGIAWVLIIGPRAAAAGFTAGPDRVLSYFGASGHQASHLIRPGGAFTNSGAWLWRQSPIALTAAAVEAAVAGWLAWLHTDSWALPPTRPGLVTAAKRWNLTRTMRAGEVVTRDGGCIGVVPRSGARVGIAWNEAAGGVLCTGAAGQELTATSFQLVHAALRRRMPVIAVDLTGDALVTASLSAVCEQLGTPLRAFGASCYEPFRGGPAARTALLLAMASPAQALRHSCEAYLLDVFELLDAAPSPPGVPVVDDVLHLLNPAALQARMNHVPAGHPRRDALADRIRVSARLVESEPQVTASLAQRLRDLRGSAAGRCIRPAADDEDAAAAIDLGRVIRERSAVVFPLGGQDRGGQSAVIARLVCQDLLGVAADLVRLGAPGDGLVWLCGCEDVPGQVLSDLIVGGAASGLPVLATTTAASAAAELAGQVNALVVHRLADEVAPHLLAPFSASADGLSSLRAGEFMLAVNAPRRRVIELAQALPARLPRPPSVASASPAGLVGQAAVSCGEAP